MLSQASLVLHPPLIFCSEGWTPSPPYVGPGEPGFPTSSYFLFRSGLCWLGVGWIGLEWGGLGWLGLGLGWAGLGWTFLGREGPAEATSKSYK